ENFSDQPDPDRLHAAEQQQSPQHEQRTIGKSTAVKEPKNSQIQTDGKPCKSRGGSKRAKEPQRLLDELHEKEEGEEGQQTADVRARPAASGARIQRMLRRVYFRNPIALPVCKRRQKRMQVPIYREFPSRFVTYAAKTARAVVKGYPGQPRGYPM